MPLRKIMSLKNICSIPRTWNLADYSAHNCRDGSHAHFSRRQIYEAEQKGLVVWLRVAASRRETSVVWILPEHDGPSTKKSSATGPVNTGLSNRVGEQLATAVYLAQPWARVMLDHINMRRAESSNHRQAAALKRVE
jgi:hypothetical protein